MDERRHVPGEIFPQWEQLARLADEKIGDRVLEPRRMRHDIAQGDGFAEVRRYLEIQVVVDIAIEIELARLHELHHGGPGEELRYRAGTKERPIGDHRAARFGIGKAVSLG